MLKAIEVWAKRCLAMLSAVMSCLKDTSPPSQPKAGYFQHSLMTVSRL